MHTTSMHCATAQGVCLLPGGGIPACTEADPPPPLWTEFLTHATENMTLPQTSFAGGKKLAPVGLDLMQVIIWLLLVLESNA